LETIAVGIISSSPVRQRQRISARVIGFRDQQHRAAARGAVAHLPLHAEAIGNRREAGL